MRVFRIRKKSGGFRTIHAPSKSEKQEMRKLLPALTGLAVELDENGVSHGFMPGRSAVTNAMSHVGDWEYTISLDLEDFFDTVDAHHVYCLSAKHIKRFKEIIYGKGVFPPKQGLPTSPVIANIAFSAMDSALFPKGTVSYVYTRYADDLTFSVSCERDVQYIMSWVPAYLAGHNWKVNARKTRVQWAKAGRRVVTGVAVDQHGIHPTRSAKRKLRAAKHQGNVAQAAGLEEWCKLRTPGSSRSLKKLIKNYQDAYLAVQSAPSQWRLTVMMQAEMRLEVAATRIGMNPSEVLKRAMEVAWD